MNEQITIQVSDRVARQAAHAAVQSRRRVEEVLADWLEWAVTEMPVESLSDEEVLGLTELQLTAEQQKTLDDLLEQNREGALDAEGRRHLDELMRIYEHGLLRKAQALRVAVRRGAPPADWNTRLAPAAQKSCKDAARRWRSAPVTPSHPDAAFAPFLCEQPPI